MKYIILMIISAIAYLNCNNQKATMPGLIASKIDKNVSITENQNNEFSIDTSIEQSFSNLKYDKIVAYDFIGFRGEHIIPIVDNVGNLIDGAQIKKHLLLSESQSKRLINTLSDVETYKGTSGVSCYEPRLAFVLYSENKIIGHVMICLSCMRMESTIRLPNGTKFVNLGEIGRQRFAKFCSELQFSSCNHWGDKY